MERRAELSETLYYIATSLRQLDGIMSLPTCDGCAKYGACEYQPDWGHPTRYNCPMYEKDDDEPCST